jgi:hypothetical protein
MTTESMKATIGILEGQVRQMRAAYAKNTPGITYDDMAGAARRLLEMRIAIEKATGRPVRTTVSKKAVANLLRSL